MNTQPAKAEQPAYKRVAGLIRDAVHRGELPPGKRLPSLPELGQQYGESKSIIERAIRSLVTEGVVTTEQGRGNFVSPFVRKILRNATTRYQKPNREKAHDGRPSRGAFETELRGMGFAYRSDNLVDRAMPAPTAAAALGISTDEVSAVLRHRVMYAVPLLDPSDVNSKMDPEGRATPVQVADTYLPLAIAAGTRLEADDTGEGGTKSRLADLGYAQARIEETVNVRPPTPAECQALKLLDTQPVFELAHVARTAEGQAVEVTLHVMPCHLWSLRYDWALDSTD